MTMTEDPRDYGLTASDLRDAADRLYAPGDNRLHPIDWTHDTQVRYGQIRSRLRGLADAIDHPEEVMAATEAYRAESDALERFLDQRCMTGHGSCGSTELFTAWSKWCSDEGEDAGTATAFATMLQNKGFDNYTSSGRRRWRGLGLQDEDPR